MKTILALLIAVWSVSVMATNYITPPGCGTYVDGTEVFTTYMDITSPSVSEPIIVFSHNGDVTWRGHKVESDAEFKSAIIDFVRYINNPAGYVPHSSK